MLGVGLLRNAIRVTVITGKQAKGLPFGHKFLTDLLDDKKASLALSRDSASSKTISTCDTNARIKIRE